MPGGAMDYVRHGTAADFTVHIGYVLDLRERGGRTYLDLPQKRY
jgi:hypothetical protein